jgi:hypothetical protein
MAAATDARPATGSQRPMRGDHRPEGPVAGTFPTSTVGQIRFCSAPTPFPPFTWARGCQSYKIPIRHDMAVPTRCAHLICTPSRSVDQQDSTPATKPGIAEAVGVAACLRTLLGRRILDRFFRNFASLFTRRREGCRQNANGASTILLGPNYRFCGQACDIGLLQRGGVVIVTVTVTVMEHLKFACCDRSHQRKCGFLDPPACS